MLKLLGPAALVRTVLLQLERLVAACTRRGETTPSAVAPAGAVLGRRYGEVEQDEPRKLRWLRSVSCVDKREPQKRCSAVRFEN